MLTVMPVMTVMTASTAFSKLKHRGVKKIIGVKFRSAIDKL